VDNVDNLARIFNLQPENALLFCYVGQFVDNLAFKLSTNKFLIYKGKKAFFQFVDNLDPKLKSLP